MTAGSIAGAGTYFLGSKQLTVGSNNLSTTVSGLIEDGGASGGAGGSLVKVGTGTLTIDGAGTYTGGTTVSGGTLVVGDFVPTRLPLCRAADRFPWGQAARSVVTAASLET